MYEIPEALNVSRQLNTLLPGKVISDVAAGQTPHKLAWYYGQPEGYQALLSGKRLGQAKAFGGFIELEAGDAAILLGEGVNIRYHAPGEARPAKHQLLIEFEDGSALSCAIQMYGGMGAYRAGTLDNKYYLVAKGKPSPLSDGFDRAYFDSLLHADGMEKLAAKAFLATEQRVPGLGNGVLQDILYNAKLHPKRKVGWLSASEKDALYDSVRDTLAEMAALGGRDTERDLFGCAGGYITKLSKNTAGKPCPVCGGDIVKEAYMGGSVYYCTGCQKLE